MEKWLPVLRLYSFDSKYHITGVYNFKKGKYFVSDQGRFMRDGEIITTKADGVGTYTFSLDGHRFKLHQIVLQTFRPEGIKDGYSPDHIDRNNRQNNSLPNLRWADKQTQAENRENRTYKYKKVYCKETDKVYESCQKAESELFLPRNMVSRVARGERKSVHGYHFKYLEYKTDRLAKERLDQETAQMNIYDFLQ